MIDLLQQNLFYTLLLFFFFFIVFIGEFPYFLISLKLWNNRSRWKVIFAHNKESRFYLFFVSLVPVVFFLLLSGLFAYVFYLFFNSYILFWIILAYLLISVVIFIRLPADSIKRIDTDFILFVFSKAYIDNASIQKIFFDYPKKLAWIIGAIFIVMGILLFIIKLVI